MTLVFLNVTGGLGGAERVLLTLLKELRRLKPNWKITVVAGVDGPLLPAVRDLGCQAEVLAYPNKVSALGDWGVQSKLSLIVQLVQAMPSVLRYGAKLRRRVQELEPHVVQSNGFKMHVLGALAFRSGQFRLAWHVHDFVSNRTVMKVLLRFYGTVPKAIVAISDAVAADLRLLGKLGQIRTIWNSVDLSRFAAAALPEGDTIRIGLVATFARWKGHEVFLRALALLPKELQWRAYVVGGEVYSRAASQYTAAELQSLSAELGLTEQVEFTGFLADPAGLIESLDIVVHASTEPEPFGLVIAEGMAAARAVVTSSESLITDDVDGLTHRSGDVTGLACALERLIRNPELRLRLGKAARATAEARFQPERMAREFIALYEEIA